MKVFLLWLGFLLQVKTFLVRHAHVVQKVPFSYPTRTHIDSSGGNVDTEVLVGKTGKQGQHSLKRGTGSINNNRILQIFQSGRNRKEYLEGISAALEDSDKWNHVHAVTLLHRCSKNSVDISLAMPLHKVVEIMQRDNFRPFTPSEISQALFGLKIFSDKKEGMTTFIEFINAKIDEVGTKWFKGGETALCLWGLQSFTSANDPSVKTLLRSIQEMLSVPTCVMNGQEYSMSLYGLRKFQSSSEVLTIVDTIASNMARDGVKAHFSAQGLSNSFNGLQQLSSNDTEVLSLLRVLTPKLESYTEPFPTRSIGGILMGLRSMSAETKEVQAVLRAVTSKVIQAQQSGEEFNAISLSSAFNGLKKMSDEEPAVCEVLAALTKSLESFQKSSKSQGFSLSYLNHLLFGLQSMTGESKELRAVIAAISNSMLYKPADAGSTIVTPISKKNSKKSTKAQSIKPVTSYDIGMSLFGLQNINVKSCPEVKGILSAIRTEILDNEPVALSNVHTAFSIYGMKTLSSAKGVPEVDELFSVLGDKIIKGSAESFSPQQVSMAMLGLKGCTSESAAVRKVIKALTPRITLLDSQAIGNTLFSMQQMSSEHEEVRGMVRRISEVLGTVDLNRLEEASYIIEEDVPMNAQELCNAIYGMQSLDSKHVEVIELLRILNQRMRVSQDVVFTSQGAGNALSGLQSMSHEDGSEVSEMVGHLADKIEAVPGPMSSRDISNALFGLQGMNSECEEVRAVLGALNIKMQDVVGEFTARDIGYCMAGMNSMQKYLYEEVDEMMNNIYLQVAKSEFGGQMDVLFLQFGKSIRVTTTAKVLQKIAANKQANKKKAKAGPALPVIPEAK